MPSFLLPTLLFILIIDLISYRMFITPTSQAKVLLDQIEGFKLSVSSYNIKEPEYYEQYLPYAIAVDLEKKWGTQFYEALRRSGTSVKNYSLPWFAYQKINVTPANLPYVISGGLTNTIFYLSMRRKGDWN